MYLDRSRHRWSLHRCRHQVLILRNHSCQQSLRVDCLGNDPGWPRWGCCRIRPHPCPAVVSIRQGTHPRYSHWGCRPNHHHHDRSTVWGRLGMHPGSFPRHCHHIRHHLNLDTVWGHWAIRRRWCHLDCHHIRPHLHQSTVFHLEEVVGLFYWGCLPIHPHPHRPTVRVIGELVTCCTAGVVPVTITVGISPLCGVSWPEMSGLFRWGCPRIHRHPNQTIAWSHW